MNTCHKCGQYCQGDNLICEDCRSKGAGWQDDDLEGTDPIAPFAHLIKPVVYAKEKVPPPEMFTEEQMREAIEMATQMTDFAVSFKYTSDQIIDQLKQAK